jgi:hypothetical protein
MSDYKGIVVDVQTGVTVEVIEECPIAISPTPGQIQRELVCAVQAYLDDTAKTRNYDGILSACTYATSTAANFQAEGQACVAWRDAVWLYCYQVMADIQADRRTIPTVAELVTELPVLTW